MKARSKSSSQILPPVPPYQIRDLAATNERICIPQFEKQTRKINWHVHEAFTQYTVMLILLFNINYTLAQPTDARVTFTVAPSGVVNGMFYVQLPDSAGYSNVDVQLIDTLEDSILFARNFVFDQTSGLPPGISWQRMGTELQLGIGTFPVRIAWLGKVRLKTSSGQWSDWYEFLFSQ